MALRIHEILKEQGKQKKWLAEQLEITEAGLWLIITEKVNVIELFEDYKKVISKGNINLTCPHCGNELDISITIK